MLIKEGRKFGKIALKKVPVVASGALGNYLGTSVSASFAATVSNFQAISAFASLGATTTVGASPSALTLFIASNPVGLSIVGSVLAGSLASYAMSKIFE